MFPPRVVCVCVLFSGWVSSGSSVVYGGGWPFKGGGSCFCPSGRCVYVCMYACVFVCVLEGFLRVLLSFRMGGLSGGEEGWFCFLMFLFELFSCFFCFYI